MARSGNLTISEKRHVKASLTGSHRVPHDTAEHYLASVQVNRPLSWSLEEIQGACWGKKNKIYDTESSELAGSD